MTSRPGKSGRTGGADADEEYEVLDVRDIGKEAESLLKSVQKYLKKNSHSKQLAVGGVSGWYLLKIKLKLNKHLEHIIPFWP